MDKLVLALGPVFAAGLAVQHFLEFADPLTDKIKTKRMKRLLMSSCSLVIGMCISFGTGLQVLGPLGVPHAGIFDQLVTGVIISAGTEGMNSIMKFLGYAKDQSKQQVVQNTAPVDRRERLRQAA